METNRATVVKIRLLGTTGVLCPSSKSTERNIIGTRIRIKGPAGPIDRDLCAYTAKVPGLIRPY